MKKLLLAGWLFMVVSTCQALSPYTSGTPLPAGELQAQMRTLYGFDRSYPEQFVSWVWRALHGDLGTSIASGRPVTTEVLTAVGHTLRLAVLATLIERLTAAGVAEPGRAFARPAADDDGAVLPPAAALLARLSPCRASAMSAPTYANCW